MAKQVLPPRVPFQRMRSVLNDIFHVEPSALRRYRAALALDQMGWRCVSCDAALDPFALCAATRCIALRQNAAVRRVTVVS